MSRTTIALSFAMVMAGLAYLYLGPGSQPTPPAPPVARTSPSRSVAPPGLITPLQALAASRQRFHLPPDRRFVQAMAIVASFPDSKQTVTPVIRLEDSAWTVSLDGKVIGHLPAYPDFDDLLALLRDEVATLDLKPVPDTAARSGGDDAPFDDLVLIQSLEALDQGYRPGVIQVADLKQAASRMARLAYFEDGATEAGDGVYAKSLALLALAEALGGGALPKSEGLLASAMGYSAAASRRALSLPTEDPWRLYFTRSDEALQQDAMLAPQSGELRYFWLRRLADLDRPADWVSWMKTRYAGERLPLNALQTVSALEGHAPVIVGAYGVPAAVLTALGEGDSALDLSKSVFLDPKGEITRLEDGLGHLKTPPGPYLDVTDLEGYYRGDFYAAVEAYGGYLIDLWSRASDAKHYLALLNGAPGEGGQELARWYADKIASEEGGRGLSGVVDDMAKSRVIGPNLYGEMLLDFGNRLDKGGVTVRGAAMRLAPLFDTRPALKHAYADFLCTALDVPDSDDIYQSFALQEMGDDSYIQVFLYWRDGDAASLLKVARDRHLGSWLRAKALGYLAKLDYSAESIDATYEDILAEYPTEGAGYEGYLTFLNGRHDYAGAARVAKTWVLSQPDDKNIFDFWNATDSLAEAELDQGDAHEAWFTLVPALFEDRRTPAPGTKAEDLDTTGYGRSIELGYTIAMANHDPVMAEALAEDDARTYPDNIDSQTEMLRYWWATGHDDEAAALLATWPHPLANWQWDHVIGAAFAKTVGADAGRAGAAFSALVKRHVATPSLYDLIDAVSDAGQPKIAFELFTALGLRGGDVENAVSAYIALKKYEPQASAEQWLDGVLSKDSRDYASMYFYAMHEHALLWDLVDPTKTAHPEEVWLLRAAAISEGEAVTAAQRQSLDDYLKQAGPGWYPVLARYLTSGADEAAIEGKPLAPRALSEASYYLALRAFSLGHYGEGAEWLQVDLDTGEVRNGEFIWGQRILENDVDSGESLKRLGSEDKLFDYTN